MAAGLTIFSSCFPMVPDLTLNVQTEWRKLQSTMFHNCLTPYQLAEATVSLGDLAGLVCLLTALTCKCSMVSWCATYDPLLQVLAYPRTLDLVALAEAVASLHGIVRANPNMPGFSPMQPMGLQSLSARARISEMPS